jgi:hypothetical protein
MLPPDKENDMTMTPGMRIAAAVVGGYVLGRRKKAKAAIAMGAWLVGKKLNLDPQKLLTEVTHQLASSPQLSGLRDQVRDEMLSAGKTMATAIVARQVNKVTSSLQDRTESLLHGPEEGVEKGVEKGKETAKKASKGLRGRFTRRGGDEDVGSPEDDTVEEFDEAAEDESDASYADETEDRAESYEADEDRGEEDEREERATNRRQPAGARRPATTGRSSNRAGSSSSETSPARRSAPRESSGRSQPTGRATTSSGKTTSARRSDTSARRSDTSQSGSSAERGTTAKPR